MLSCRYAVSSGRPRPSWCDFARDPRTKGFFGRFPIDSKTTNHPGHRATIQTAKTRRSTINHCGRTHTATLLSTPRRGQTQLIEQKVIVDFSQIAQLILNQLLRASVNS